MPLSSVLGASSVIKPGVCTSTTRPSVPYEGQLIYETDTDRIAAYNGSAWVYTATGGLVYLTGTAFSGAVSFSLPSSTFTSTYQTYRLWVQITTQATNNSTLTMRMRASGSDNTTSNYSNVINGVSVAGTTQYNTNVNGGTSFTIGLTRSGYSNPSDTQTFVFDIISPQESQSTTIHGTAFTQISASLSGGGVIIGQFSATTSFDALSIISSSGNIAGSYKVYGYANS